jgi:hypothetical protein
MRPGERVSVSGVIAGDGRRLIATSIARGADQEMVTDDTPPGRPRGPD